MTTIYKYTPEIVFDYIEEVDPNLMCAICHSALVDPVTTTSCKHTFCRDCISQAISINPSCPIDRSALTLGSLRDTEQLVKLMLDEIKVRCAVDDCGMIMQRGLLLGHLRTCQKAVITCQNEECGLSMARHRLPHHRAYECFQRKMECGKCGVLLTFRDRKAHIHENTEPSDKCAECGGDPGELHQWSCPRTRIQCIHQSHGCPTILPRVDLPTHLATCPFQALSSFFEINDTRWKEVQERNERLQAQVDVLQGEIAELRRDGVLGRRMERETLQSEMVELMREQPESPQRSEREGRRRLSSMPQVPLAAPNVTAHTNTTNPGANDEPTLGTNPLFSGITHRAAADINAARRVLFSPPFGSHQAYADFAFNRLPPGMSPDETINALRRVVVQLAAGLDTMERRNEVRTMTESLRVLEEVGSLRAIVSTMRMQVMMDRPFRPIPFPSPAFRPFPPTHSTQPTQPFLPITTTTTTTSQNSVEPQGGSSQQRSMPFSSYMNPSQPFPHLMPLSPDTHPVSLDDDEESHSVRESIVLPHAARTQSRTRGEGAGSTSSLVTLGPGPGRPMGLPTEREMRGPLGRSSSHRLSRNPISMLSRRINRDTHSGSRL